MSVDKLANLANLANLDLPRSQRSVRRVVTIQWDFLIESFVRQPCTTWQLVVSNRRRLIYESRAPFFLLVLI